MWVVGSCSIVTDLRVAFSFSPPSMDRESVDKLKSFTLTTEENEEISLEEGDIVKSKNECARSLIGKIFGSKKTNFSGLRNTVTNIWQTKEAFAVREIGDNLFQFVFCTQEDKTRVMNGKTWTFDNQYLILREWNNDIFEQIKSINTVEMWVQVWNLPYHWLCLGTGRKIGKKFGNFADVVIPESGSSKGRHIKILAEINLEKPLLRGTNVKLGLENCWVDFKYENLQGFCYYCGKIGHAKRMCLSRREDLKNDTFKDGQFGEWMRALDLVFGRLGGKTFKNRNGFETVSKHAEKATNEDDKKSRQSYRSVQETVGSVEGENGGVDIEVINKTFSDQPSQSELGMDKMVQSGNTPNLTVDYNGFEGKSSTINLRLDKENILNLESLELINVPTKMKGKRLPLKVIQCNSASAIKRQVKNPKQIKKNWKMKGNEIPEASPMEIVKEKEYNNCGRKRNLELLDEEEPKSSDPKKSKVAHIEESSKNSKNEVEVASLNWAQPYQ